jgi:uncharacterized protein (DUF1800 family)
MRRWRRGLLTALPIAVVLSIAGCPAPPGPGGPGAPGDGNPVDGASNGGGTGLDGGSNGGVDGGNPGDALNRNPTVSVTVSPGGAVTPGASVTLTAAGQDPDGDALSYVWSQVDGPEVVFGSPQSAQTSLAAPYALNNTHVTLRVTVTDGRGGSATADAGFDIAVAAQFAGNPNSLQPYREQLSSDEAWHFLRRTEFGTTPQRVAEVASKPLSVVVDEMIQGKPVPQSLLDLEDSFEYQASKRWLARLLLGPNPFHERMTMFWHDRFATSARVAVAWNDRFMGQRHMEMLRANALGNYRQFLIDLTLDPLMLLWLDGANSPASAPNENYAREFWELFTLGRDVLYTEGDIREAARAFTGITLFRARWDEEARPIFDIRNHDNTNKNIFPGRAAPANYDYLSIIDLTLRQPEAPRYVARNLFAYFVHDEPSDEVLTQLADELVNNNWELAPVVRMILRSQAMFSHASRYNQIVSPVEQVVGAARTLDVRMFREETQGYMFDQLQNHLRDAGQLLMDPPGVEGWTEGPAWLGDQWLISRARGVATLMQFDFGPDNTPRLPLHLLPPQSEWNQRGVQNRIVDAMAGVLHLTLTPEEREIYIDVLNQSGYLAFHLQNANDQRTYLTEMVRLMLMDERIMTR